MVIFVRDPGNSFWKVLWSKIKIKKKKKENQTWSGALKIKRSIIISHSMVQHKTTNQNKEADVS